jgi:7-carboxy-7-deazaguanine synthase
MTVAAVLAEVHRYGCPLVEITGGEPLAQPAALELMEALCDEGYEVLLETGGSLDISPVDPRVCRIVDLKCPASGMSDRNLWGNLDDLRSTDEVKFVVRDRADFEWAAEVIVRYDILRRCTVLMSPVFGDLEPAVLARWILADGLPARMQLQMHKYIWEPSARGV